MIWIMNNPWIAPLVVFGMSVALAIAAGIRTLKDFLESEEVL